MTDGRYSMKPIEKSDCILNKEDICIAKNTECKKICKDSISSMILNGDNKITFTAALTLYFDRINTRKNRYVQIITLIISLISLAISVYAVLNSNVTINISEELLKLLSP